MPRRPLDVEDVLADRLAVMSPENMAMQALIKDAESVINPSSAQPSQPVTDAFDKRLLRLIESVTLD